MNLYCIYDERSRSIANVFLSATNESAQRQFIDCVASNEFVCKFPDGFCLKMICDIDELPIENSMLYTASEALTYMESVIKKNTLNNISSASFNEVAQKDSE